MVEQVVGLRFVTEGAAEATASIKRLDQSQASLTGSISKSYGITKRTEAEVRKLTGAYVGGNLNLKQYYQALSQTSNAYGQFLGNTTLSRQQVEQLSSALLEEARSQGESTKAKAAAAAAARSAAISAKQEADSIRQYAEARRQANEANRRFDSEQANSAAAAARLEKAILDQGRAFAEAVRGATQYTQANKSAEGSASVFEAELRKQEAALQRTAKVNQEYLRSLQTSNQANKSAEDSASVFSAELRKQEAAFTRTARANQEYMRSLQTANQANKSAESSASVFEAELRRQEAAVERLSMKYKPLYAASKQYERSLEELNSAHALNVLSAKQHEQAVERLATEYQQFQSGTAGWSNQFIRGSDKARRSTNSMGVAIQQTGYQVGDFLVQVQSGTNPMVAFGQQATQLVGVLPLVAGSLGLTTAAAIGLSTALGIGIPLVTAIGAYFMRTKRDTDEATESLAEYEKKLRSVQSGVGAEEQGYMDAIAAAMENVITKQEILDTRSKQTGGEALTLETRRLNAAKEALAVEEARLARFREISLAIATTDPLDAFGGAGPDLDADRERLQILEDIRISAEERIAQYEREIAMNQAILAYGKDSVQVEELKRAQAMAVVEAMIKQEQLGDELAKRMRDAAAAAYDTSVAAGAIDLGGAVSDAAMLAQNLNAAARALAGVISATANLNIGAIGIEAQNKALKAGNSIIKARAEGLIATKKAELSTAFGSGDGAIRAAATAEMNRYTEAVYRNSAANEENQKLTTAMSNGGGSSGGGGGAAKSNVIDIQEIIAKRNEQIAQERVLLGLTGQQRAEMEIYYDLTKGMSDEQLASSEQFVMAEAKKIAALQQTNDVLKEQQAEQQQIADTISSSMGSAFMSIIDGTKSVGDAFKDMARAIIAELIQVLIIKRAVSAVTSFLGFADGGVFSNGSQVSAYANGGAFSGGNVIPFANGGVVNSPMTFPMSGGKTGLMGEAGPEAIMPLKRGKDGKLGVAADGGGAVTVVQNFNFSANGDDSVKKIIAQAAPQIANMAKTSLLNDRRRGGSTKAAFG